MTNNEYTTIKGLSAALHHAYGLTDILLSGATENTKSSEDQIESDIERTVFEAYALSMEAAGYNIKNLISTNTKFLSQYTNRMKPLTDQSFTKYIKLFSFLQSNHLSDDYYVYLDAELALWEADINPIGFKIEYQYFIYKDTFKISLMNLKDFKETEIDPTELQNILQNLKESHRKD